MKISTAEFLGLTASFALLAYIIFDKPYDDSQGMHRLEQQIQGVPETRAPRPSPTPSVSRYQVL